MAGKLVAGIEIEFNRWDANGSKWEAIAEVTSIDGPSKSKDTVETTSLSTTGGYKTFIGTLRDGGTVSLEMNFTRETYDIMDADFESDLNFNYEIVLPDDDETSIEFEAAVTELGLSIPVGELITAPVTLKVSGKPTTNSGANSSLHG